MVFHALPECRWVTPMTSWQLLAPSGWMYLKMVRRLQVSGAADVRRAARLLSCTSGDGMTRVGGIAEQVEDGGLARRLRLEADVRIAAANVEEIEVGELVGVADVDDTGTADVERA